MQGLRKTHVVATQNAVFILLRRGSTAVPGTQRTSALGDIPLELCKFLFGCHIPQVITDGDRTDIVHLRIPPLLRSSENNSSNKPSVKVMCSTLYRSPMLPHKPFATHKT
jgi:hypothetical protein